MTIEPFWGCLALGAGVARLSALRRFWRMARKRGDAWFLAAEVGEGFYTGAGADVLRRYRRALFLPFLADAPGVALGIARDRFDWIVVDLGVMLIFSSVIWNLVVAHFSVKARAMSPAAGGEKPAPASVPLEPRRLRDHTSAVVEVAVVALLAIGAGLSYLAGDARAIRVCAWFLYAQLGALLLKHVFVHWRMKLPARRVEDYLRWRKAWLAWHLRVFDSVRLLCAYVVLISGLRSRFEVHPWAEISLLAASIVYVGALMTGRRALSVVEREVQPWTLLKEFRPAPIAEGRFAAGGLVLVDAGNPSIVVRGPEGIAINVANWHTWAWVGYSAGFVAMALALT